jgi:predicted metal-binding protein
VDTNRVLQSEERLLSILPCGFDEIHYKTKKQVIKQSKSEEAVTFSECMHREVIAEKDQHKSNKEFCDRRSHTLTDQERSIIRTV